MGQIGHTQVRLEDFMISSACAELYTHIQQDCVSDTLTIWMIFLVISGYPKLGPWTNFYIG